MTASRTRAEPTAGAPPFEPDSFMVADVVPSPNFDDRNGGPPDILLLHYTGMQSGEAALARLTAAESKVSSHYVVFEDGRIVQCVPEDKRAWHAGVSSWAGESDINSRSIGIEIVNPGHEFGYDDFPLRQIAAVITLSKSILKRHPAIVPERVLAHSDVAPARKQDPGEKFPWELLADSGVGHCVRAAPLNVAGMTLMTGYTGEAVGRLQRLLKSYGYGIEETGTYDEVTRDVVAAFQRHFRQARVDGVADPSTLMTLRALVETRPKPSV
ncbi:MAG: N-acetylmuramoyl-L-alanine amidase [Candidatus Eiseniibacteriota bacterium]